MQVELNCLLLSTSLVLSAADSSNKTLIKRQLSISMAIELWQPFIHTALALKISLLGQ